MRQRSRSRAALAAVAAMCAVAALPGQVYAAGGPAAYTFDPGAKAVSGAEVSTDATELKSGSVYKSSIKVQQKLYYRLALDAKTNVYVSAVVVPKDDGQVAYGDGITISIRDSSDQQCSSEHAQFESAGYSRPIAAYAHRDVEEDSSSCRAAGTYNVLIERESKDTSGPGDWDLEIRYVSEPKLGSQAAPIPTEAPEEWPSASPLPPTPAADNRRYGGSSYYDATSLETGEWKDEVAPGQTLFYRVPVDWGQQIFATAKLSNSTAAGKKEYVSSALAMSLDNPAHGHVTDVSPLAYQGEPASVAFDPVPPVAYENRFDSDSSVSAMRFAGWYYLSVTLSPEVAEDYGDKPFPLTLVVKVVGKADETPYAGDAGIFGVTQDDKDMARNGQSGSQAAESGSSTMKLVAAAGIGAGAVLVLWLGVWTLLARRRASSAPAGGQQHPYGGPPQAW
ncbi:hypothetical protein OG782_18290 [Streptomyces sp. NBC_00876]|uniref:hypothetical protein n=1 Tax=Streptomyces sp. NBC_00876 TaxID=2975853 RepID=UPI0038670748|nr:hypothetical protein OG782_18290 [Streptomyces sp. NBC_00876]